jgi:hypothetical protein
VAKYIETKFVVLFLDLVDAGVYTNETKNVVRIDLLATISLLLVLHIPQGQIVEERKTTKQRYPKSSHTK